MLEEELDNGCRTRFVLRQPAKRRTVGLTFYSCQVRLCGKYLTQPLHVSGEGKVPDIPAQSAQQLDHTRFLRVNRGVERSVAPIGFHRVDLCTSLDEKGRDANRAIVRRNVQRTLPRAVL